MDFAGLPVFHPEVRMLRTQLMYDKHINPTININAVHYAEVETEIAI